MNPLNTSQSLQQTIPVRQSRPHYHSTHPPLHPSPSSQIHYVTVPFRLTLSTSPSASQTRPLEVQLNQLQNHHIIKPQFEHLPINKIRRNKIFGGEEKQHEDFTPRRRIYVESKYAVNFVEGGKNKQGRRDGGGVGMRILEEDSRIIEKNEKENQQNKEFNRIQPNSNQEINRKQNVQQNLSLNFNINFSALDIDHQQFQNDTDQQIRQQLENIRYQTLLTVPNKYSQSFNSPFNNHFGDDVEFEEMSVQIGNREKFVGALDFSPIAPQRVGRVIEEELFFQEQNEKNNNKQINENKDFQKEQQFSKEQIHQINKVQQIKTIINNKQPKTYFYSSIIAIVISFLIFQIIK